MSKKGATKTGGSTKRAQDAAMSTRLPPAPKTWNSRPTEWPYHSNKGTTHEKPGKRAE